MTGWEIVASLPLEEQLNTHFSPAYYPEPIRKKAEEDSHKIIEAVRILRAMSTLYEWNGEKWSEVKEQVRKQIPQKSG